MVTTPVIIDIAVVVILVIFTMLGARRGLLRAVAGLVIAVMALVGAALAAGALADPVTGVVSPLIARHITQQVDAAMEEHSAQMPEAGEEDPEGIEALLALVGLDSDVRASVTERVQETVRDTGVSVATAVVESMTRSVVYGALFLLAFVGLTVLLRVLLKAMDLVLQLPGLHLLNTLGGGAVGLIQGALVLFLAIWILRRLGVSFETEALSSAHILGFFTANTPLSALSFLQ